MWQDNKRFEFSDYVEASGTPGVSGFGFAHGAGAFILPTLPGWTPDLTNFGSLNAAGAVANDLTHLVFVSDFASAKGGSGGGGGGGGGGGKGGGGGGPGGGGGATDTYGPYTSGPADSASGYNITIEFSGEGWNDNYYNLFVAAADKLTSLILGDVPDAKLIGGGGRPTIIDDIVISAEITYIDGVNGILGQAGPTSYRTSDYLPATAIMQFDSADVSTFDALNLFDDIILHEMSHSLGFGSIWSLFDGLVVNGLYSGDAAVAEFAALLNVAVDQVAGIPVETDGGPGTAGSHWDEGFFDNELMTGYIDNSNYFSKMSAASFADLGYTIADYSTLAWVGSSYTLPA